MRINKFLNRSNNSPNLQILNIGLWIAITLIAFAYNLPWISSRSVGLTMDAFDLAEWTSLNPEVITSSPSLLTTLLLRLIPLFIITILAINTPPPRKSYSWWTSAFITLVVAIAMFPPLEFLTSDYGNINYRQQFAISLGVFAVGCLGLSGIIYRFRHIITIITSILAIVTSIIGLTTAFQLYADFYLPREISIGGILTILGCIIVIGVTILQMRRTGKEKG